MSNRRDVLTAYQSYLDAFANSDDEAIRGHLQWPCTFLMDGRSETLDRFPYSPNALKSEKDWATSTHLEIEVVAVSATKAHVLLRNCERLRPDGTLVEEVSAFYAFTRTAEGWKIFAMSSIEFPSA
jgi:hypothetical protein